jgi:hypothetical protein
MGLSIGKEKSKFTALSRKNADKSSLKVESFSFKKVDDFKYLGINNINRNGNMHREITERKTKYENKYYFSINKLLNNLLSIKSKITLYNKLS